jgi:hypothetical protein
MQLLEFNVNEYLKDAIRDLNCPNNFPTFISTFRKSSQ